MDSLALRQEAEQFSSGDLGTSYVEKIAFLPARSCFH